MFTRELLRTRLPYGIDPRTLFVLAESQVRMPDTGGPGSVAVTLSSDELRTRVYELSGAAVHTVRDVDPLPVRTSSTTPSVPDSRLWVPIVR